MVILAGVLLGSGLETAGQTVVLSLDAVPMTVAAGSRLARDPDVRDAVRAADEAGRNADGSTTNRDIVHRPPTVPPAAPPELETDESADGDGDGSSEDYDG